MTVAGLAASLLLVAGPASAQVEIGIMIGQMQSQHNEAICEANRRPDPVQRQAITRKVNLLMQQLHDPATPPKDLAKLFSKVKGAKVADVNRLITQAELRAELTSGPPGVWKQLVVGADHRSARGVWRMTIPGADGGPETVREFGFDFASEMNGWKVVRAQEYPGPLFAPEPDPFCHLATTSSY